MAVKDLQTLVSFCKSTGFVYPGSEIYGGLTGSYSYGPLGVELKKNLKNLWWQTFVQRRPDVVGIEGDIILHPKTWHASGHVAGFNDQMVDCKTCKARHRADHLVEDALGIDCEGMSDERVTGIIREHHLRCPHCGSEDLTEVRKFNLMFQTQLSKTGEDSTAYLRPETAQAIFLEFKNVTQTQRVQVPFAIANEGRAFRNEITPGNFLFRRLEFEQMEIQHFIRPETWQSIYADWATAQDAWLATLGFSPSDYRVYEHPADKLAHYAQKAEDREFRFSFGTKEIMGLHYRTDFDLTQHQSLSGKDLRYRDPHTGEQYIPHVVETTWGVDRNLLALLDHGYTEETLDDGSTRVVMQLPAQLSPYKVAVLPLMKKDGLSEKAQEIWQSLSPLGYGVMDESGSIGKRYRRQDEAGTPACVTVDYETLESGTVTVRDRDTMQQTRHHVRELLPYLRETYVLS
ncbi:glycine--tRNA ligase [Candidatus Peribacteria bacterium]|nr:glycine--tRNA ligase [Candidatus Peribacteria bacterium]